MNFDRFTMTVVAGAGLCVAAMALTPNAAAVPLKTGGTHCVYDSAGNVIAGAGGAAGAAGGAVPASACCAGMGGG
ncbi:MAG: beta-xylosidase, partial [Mycobacterium sp.]